MLRGHNEPGGGFTGGLVASAGFALYGLAQGPRAVRRALNFDVRALIGAGLLLALASALVPVTIGQPFFRAIWWEISPGDAQIKFGTPTFFDFGVYLVVIGVVLTIIFAREEA